MAKNDLRHHYFLWFYGLADNSLAYLRQPQHVLHNLNGLIGDDLLPGWIKPAAALLIESGIYWLEIMALALFPFFLLLLVRKPFPYQRVLRAIAFSLPPVLYVGAVWGFLVGERLRYFDSFGGLADLLWGLPYFMAHGALFYFIYVGFLALYETRYPLPRFMRREEKQK